LHEVFFSLLLSLAAAEGIAAADWLILLPAFSVDG